MYGLFTRTHTYARSLAYSCVCFSFSKIYVSLTTNYYYLFCFYSVWKTYGKIVSNNLNTEMNSHTFCSFIDTNFWIWREFQSISMGFFMWDKKDGFLWFLNAKYFIVEHIKLPQILPLHSIRSFWAYSMDFQDRI